MSAQAATVSRERVLLISASFGAGHDRAAQQVAHRLSAGGLAVQQVDFVDLLPAGIGRLLRRAYRTQLRTMPITWDWLLAATRRRGLGGAAASLSALSGAAVSRVVGPDTVAVVSTYPLASQVLGWLRQAGRLTVPVVTFLTDMSVHRMWIAGGVDAHLAIHPLAARQARAHGARDVRVSGPLVSPAFRPAIVGERTAARARFGLPPHGRLALVVTGSWGVGDFERTARDIAATGVATPVIACGGNKTARRRLEAAGTGIAVGWTDEMPILMRACDVVVQSGGGMSCLEALASGLPVFTYRSLPGHGRTSAAALHEAGWAPWIRDPSGLAAALATATPPVPHPRGHADADVTRVVRQLAGVPAEPLAVAA